MWTDTHPKARIEHHCELCGRTIHPGETYRRAVNLDGTAYTWKECQHCAALVVQLSGDFYIDDTYGPDELQEYAPRTVTEARWLAGFNMRWRTRNGNLLPVPGTLLDGEAKHVEDCDCDACCTHEITEYGRCAGCGQETNTEPRETLPGRTGCQNRGWYHDGSEQADAATTGRTPRPCPHHGEAKG